jgi:hypothetical protein
MIQHAVRLLYQPHNAWRDVAALSSSAQARLLVIPCLLAILPAAAWYYGSSQVGWTVGQSDDAIRLTSTSAAQISTLFYVAMVLATGAIGYFIHWMSSTYGAESSLVKGLAIAGLTATPLFFAGITGLYPILWLDMLIGVGALAWTVYLLYLGIPIVMNIPEERGFLFSSAVIAIGSVIFICILVGSVILWDFGAAPVFTD